MERVSERARLPRLLLHRRCEMNVGGTATDHVGARRLGTDAIRDSRGCLQIPKTVIIRPR